MVADQITAAINPRPVEIERHTIDAVAGLLGWTAESGSGSLYDRRS